MSNPTETPVEVTPEQLQAQIKTLQDAQTERDRKIQELTVEKATLEARATSVNSQPAAPVVDPNLNDDAIAAQTQAILEKATTDLPTASKELAGLIKKVATSTATMAANGVASSIQPTIENEKFAEKIKVENADLLALSPEMENIVAAEANAIVRGLPRQQQTFQEFQKAVRSVVAKKRETLKELLKKPEVAPVELPKGAQGEGGGGIPVSGTVPIKKADNTDDKTLPSSRLATASAKGLF